ncbi:DUF1203 domain-containing protein [Rhizobium phaseoli]|uniref:DUF1203 domain-containing protein n=1 Tax=Rhizobium phaseoli TaxID=396 RepID=UPI000F8712E9|nr:DUF1203 domain-containing protein [Rhizobium phaseoli]RUM18764.1 DUF1203 domain-containing protein [Rhizobium phaseoli]
MTAIRFAAMPTADARALWDGSRDAYDNLPETMISDGDGNPCRHCLQDIDEGEEMLVFAYRPFPELQPYAETGPIFLHKQRCARYAAEEILPPVLTTSRDFIVRGYGENNRIVYGTGAVTAIADIPAYAETLLARPEIAYVHVRSARNNCFQCRIDKANAPALTETGALT